MVRSLELVVTAILLCRPDLPQDTAEQYATWINEQAVVHDFDPLTAVTLIQHESGFDPKAVSPSGEDLGLGQIRARYIGACRKDRNPVKAPSPECRQERQRLLDPHQNIAEMARLIRQNRAICQAKTGSASLPRWLASYQGRNFPKSGRWCQPGPATWKIVEFGRSLERRAQKELSKKQGNSARGS
jgi:hypothetical protein